MPQAAGSWSLDACCAVHGNDCERSGCPGSYPCYCIDRASSSDWLFGLWPGPPQRFQPTGTGTAYQHVGAGDWPYWGGNHDLAIGWSGAPGGSYAYARDGEVRLPALTGWSLSNG